MNKKYVVRLTDEQREQIERLLRLGRAHARKLLYARVLLKADVDGPARWTVESVSYETVSRTLKKTSSSLTSSANG
jgi:DNA-binding MarR family transcriptional regulator